MRSDELAAFLDVGVQVGHRVSPRCRAASAPGPARFGQDVPHEVKALAGRAVQAHLVATGELQQANGPLATVVVCLSCLTSPSVAGFGADDLDVRQGTGWPWSCPPHGAGKPELVEVVAMESEKRQKNVQQRLEKPRRVAVCARGLVGVPVASALLRAGRPGGERPLVRVPGPTAPHSTTKRYTSASLRGTARAGRWPLRHTRADRSSWMSSRCALECIEVESGAGGTTGRLRRPGQIFGPGHPAPK